MKCDDGSAPDDAPIFTGQKLIEAAAAASGNPTTVYDEMRARIEKSGFINVQEKVMKMPYGDWPKHPVYKDAGRCNKIHYLAGVEGWTMVSLFSEDTLVNDHFFANLLTNFVVAHDQIRTPGTMECGRNSALDRPTQGRHEQL